MLNIVYSVIAAVIGLGILIIIHELGHFLVAKKTGVGVLTFSIGFGPKLFHKKIGETEYAVRDRKSTRLNSSHIQKSRMPSSA